MSSPKARYALGLTIGLHSEPVRAYHVAAARGILNDYGILPADAFDLLLVRLSHTTSRSL